MAQAERKVSEPPAVANGSTRAHILEYIQTFVQEHGYAPTLREICHALGLSSISQVHYHLKRLESEGHIMRVPRRARGIVPVRASSVRAVNVLLPSRADVAHSVASSVWLPAEWVPAASPCMLVCALANIPEIGVSQDEWCLVVPAPLNEATVFVTVHARDESGAPVAGQVIAAHQAHAKAIDGFYARVLRKLTLIHEHAREQDQEYMSYQGA